MPAPYDEYVNTYILKLQERRTYEIQRNGARTTEDTNKYQEKVNQCNKELEEMSIQNKKSKLEVNQVKELDIKKVPDIVPDVNNLVIKKETNVVVVKKKKTKEKIPASVKNTLWSKHFDNSIQGNCQCCKTELISKNNFDCGHIISEKNDGKVHLDNLKPICRSCNSSMGTTNMNDFMTKYGFDKI